MIPEFSRPIDEDTISDAPREVRIGADETERRRLAGRFRLKAIDHLEAVVTLSRRAGIVHAEGEVNAAVTQACVVTDEPVPAKVCAPFSVRFAPELFGASGEEDVELSAEDCETLPIEGGRIDLGELAAETLALALDPYPRAPGADDALAENSSAGDQEASPFAALAALKGKLGGE